MWNGFFEIDYYQHDNREGGGIRSLVNDIWEDICQKTSLVNSV